MPVTLPLTCPILIGRDAELAALDRLLVEATTGQGRVALISGEAGAGKSRLALELAARARERGWQVLQGFCTERDREFPFAPFADALRQRLGEPGSDARELVGSDAPLLVEILPELAALSPVPESPVTLSPEQGKRRVFEVCVHVLSRLAAERPLLIVLEDLHWADPTSLELLELLPRRLATARVVLVLTARADELSPELRRCLAALRRARVLTELSLDPLSEVAVGQMLGALLPAPPAPALVTAMHARTGGNPFFVEELLAALPAPVVVGWLEQHSAVPETVREAVLRRLDGLDESALVIVRLAAVAGQRVNMAVLHAAGGLPEDELATLLTELVGRNLLTVETTPRGTLVAFRHALTRDAVHVDIVPHQRRSMHARIGEALEQPSADGGSAAGAGDLGYHFHAAQAWDKALAYSMAAGQAAWGVHATVEALGHYLRALDAASALGDPQTAELQRRCGQLLALLGAFEPARRHLDAALALARVAPDPTVEQAALYDLAGLFTSRDYATAERLAYEALHAARALGDRRREGLALNRLGNVRTNLLAFDEGRRLHEEALAIFERLGDRWGTADSLDLIGATRYLAGELPEARAALGSAADIFADLDDVERLASTLTTRGLYLAVLDGPCAADAPPEAYAADAERGLQLCRAIGWRSGEAYAFVALACAEAGAGRFGNAIAHAQTALSIAEEIEHQQWQVIALLTLGILHADLLDDARALACFQRCATVAQSVGSAQWRQRAAVWIARCLSQLGDPGGARDTLTGIAPPARPASIGQRRALLTLAEIELRSGAAPAALAYLDRLLTGASGPRPPATLLLHADTLAALGDLAAAAVVLQEARRLAAELGPRALLWRIAASRARLLRELDPAQSERDSDAARAAARALAATLSTPDEASSFLQRAGYPATPEARPSTPRSRTAPTSGPGGLTRRECEVVSCVALGLSNKEITRRLSIAEKTVEMHVSNCLGKLGFTSRAQLAGWAVAEGLAEAPTSPVS